MKVVQFQAQTSNFVSSGDEEYFLWTESTGTIHLVPARCRHRGGPLWLGELVEHRGRVCVRCPWHQNNIPTQTLTRQALPMVIRRGTVTAVLPGQGEAHTRMVTGPGGHPPCTTSSSNPG